MNIPLIILALLQFVSISVYCHIKIREVLVPCILFNIICLFTLAVQGGFLYSYSIYDPDGHLLIATSSFNGSFVMWLSQIKLNAFLYSWITAPIVYSFQTVAVISILNIFIATLIVILFSKTYKLVWGEVNNLATFIVILLPINYFFIPDPTIREIVIIFLCLLSVKSLIEYEFYGRNSKGLIFFLSVVVCSFLHSAFGLVLVGYAFYRLTRSVSVQNVFYFFVLCMLVLIAFKMGLFDNKLNMLESNDLDTLQAGAARGRTAYPSLLISDSFIRTLLLLPLRVLAFFTLPTPNFITTFADIVGFVDSLFYIAIFVLIFRYRRVLVENKHLVLLFFILALLVLAFSYGTSNYGTAIRHRYKLFYLLMLFFPSQDYFKVKVL